MGARTMQPKLRGLSVAPTEKQPVAASNRHLHQVLEEVFALNVSDGHIPDKTLAGAHLLVTQYSDPMNFELAHTCGMCQLELLL